ncbi:MAG: hypothetical protein IMZ61_08410 [Planctomycetes bacterium]|nr:hypothetical protein [Planctomycetota bacterium]
MKKIKEWFRAHWKILASLAVWAALIFIVLLVGKMQLGDRIQAASVITLVFITWFYAIQTQALVKEERRALEEEMKKRQAEYGEKRIKDFLNPLIAMLENFRMDFQFTVLPSEGKTELDFKKYIDRASNNLWKIDEMFRSKMYMANDNYCGKMLQIMRDIRRGWWKSEHWSDDEKLSWLKEKDRELESIIGMLEVETHHISRQIQRTYGDYAQKNIL